MADTNPLLSDAPVTAATSPASSSGVPFAALPGRVGTALTTPTVKNIGDVLDYQRAALAQFLFGKGDSDANRAALRHAIGLDPKGFLASLPAGMGGAYKDAPLPIQGLIDAALDTVTDPLTYETMGSGALVKLLGKGGMAIARGASHITPTAVKDAAIAAAKAAKPIADEAKVIGGAAKHVFQNLVNYGAEAARAVGERGKNVGIAAKHTGEAYDAELKRRFEQINQQIMQGLKPAETSLVQQLQHGQIELKDLTQDSAKKLSLALDRRKRLALTLAKMKALGKPAEVIKNYAESENKQIMNRLSQGQQLLVRQLGKGGIAFEDLASDAVRTAYAARKKLTDDVVRLQMSKDPKGLQTITSQRFVTKTPKMPPGVTIKHQFDGRYYSSQAFDQNGKQIGMLSVDTLGENVDAGGRRLGQSVDTAGKPADTVDLYVDPDEQRRGVGSALFDSAEQHLGRPIRPDSNQTDAGKAFVQSRERRFVGTSPGRKPEDPYRYDYAGRRLEEITGQPILRKPQMVKRPFGTMVRNPELRPTPPNLRVTHMAAQRRIPLNPILQEFEGIPGDFARKNYLAKYFPATHLGRAVDPNAPARIIQPLDIKNEHLKHQDPTFIITPQKVDQWEKAFAGMLAHSAEAIGKNKTIQLLHGEFGKDIHGSIKDLIERRIAGRGTGRTPGEILEQYWKGFLNLPKIAIVGTSPAHMANITNMLAAHAPEALPDMMRHFGELAKTWSDPDARWKVLKPWIDKGIGEAFPDSQGLITTHVPGIKQMNRATWDADLAAVMALADHYEKTGVAKGVNAAMKARQALVDYANKSPLTKLASWVMPFASYGTESVKSILGAVARRPATNEAINRLTGGRYLGGGDRQSGTTYLPTAKVGRGVGDIPALVRSDVGLPVRQGLDLIPGVGKHTNNYLTYGEAPNWHWAVQEGIQPLPYGRDVIENTGMSNFKPPNPLLEFIEDATRIKLPDSMAPTLPSLKKPAPRPSTAPGGNPLLP